jgi:flagellar secretion chaperone FliS
MFSQASPFGRPQQFSNIYHAMSVETGVSGASPHTLTLMLFDGFLAAVLRAGGAMAANQIDDKCHQIARASKIMEEGLKAVLNYEGSGEIATTLNDLYTYTLKRLLQANLRNDPEALKEVTRLITPLRDAWAAIAPKHLA